MHRIRKLVDFENDEIWRVFDKVVSPGLIEITNLQQLTTMAKQAYEIELPYQSFWASMVNVLLINH